MKIPRCPDNNIPHMGAIRKKKQCETPKLTHNGIHTPSPDPTNFVSSKAKHAEIFPNLHSSLISIGQLCDNDFIVTFDKHKVIVIKHKNIIIEDYRDPKNGLWKFLPYHLV